MPRHPDTFTPVTYETLAALTGQRAGSWDGVSVAAQQDAFVDALRAVADESRPAGRSAAQVPLRAEDDSQSPGGRWGKCHRRLAAFIAADHARVLRPANLPAATTS